MAAARDTDLFQVAAQDPWDDDIGYTDILGEMALMQNDFNEQQEIHIIMNAVRLIEDSSKVDDLSEPEDQGSSISKAREKKDTQTSIQAQDNEDSGVHAEDDGHHIDDSDKENGGPSSKCVQRDAPKRGPESTVIDLDFDRSFNNTIPFFSERECLENLNIIFELVTCPVRRVRHELVNRFPRKIYGKGKERVASEVQRCMFHLPSTIVDVVLNKLMYLVLGSPSFESDSLFYFMRFLDVFAFESKYPEVFFQPRIIVPKIQVFNKVFKWFLDIFQRYRRIRDIMPSYRLKKKADMRHNLVSYAVARESYDALRGLEFHIYEEGLQSDFEAAYFFKNTTLLYYMLTFFYNRYERLQEGHKKDYLRAIFDSCE